ncbi:MAG: tRNA (adenosine(37)-N6)-threonylcarbamoyltransferase complex dimerization subunit type 1 TsaB [Nitrospirae bacterium]|nr:tRNA (adenosine(37)-N6)-threonylcarbamoyltransferase complex dimerization subunit type 1 TsaB [Nitrospirota bacterium]MCL5978462.1 tRNA (adenosine(37)-N6)-threonylcarbamoyltransferase complex dimerization subunit type 1 TsaB [Nitrospirota bacterium]
MKLLAIETSTMLGGVAIMDGDALIAESRLNVKFTHSERLMTGMDYALEQSGLKIEDIDVFAVAIGPGSFTGLRVGLSTVKGLVYATGKKLVSVPTLEAFAWNVPFSEYDVCPLLDARRKEVYAGIFRWTDDGFVRVMSEQAIKMEALMSLIIEPTIFLGEGALIYKENIKANLGDKAFFANPQHMVPSPANVAYLGMKKAAAGEFEEPIALAPMYLRKSEAEMKTGNGR